MALMSPAAKRIPVLAVGGEHVRPGAAACTDLSEISSSISMSLAARPSLLNSGATDSAVTWPCHSSRATEPSAFPMTETGSNNTMTETGSNNTMTETQEVTTP
ncbi:hypothetical protein EYF80_050734 [Liparis tanakae]|uniref:Uncharacterized protein n=1 Tax=Liparis tanakae TaxID=230148 RepID=A0A4Z2FD89_9TELE|nr:hypothetical protein EYF80_050734 [Liparis tanakae]